jgi:hypothetical protein
MKKLSIVLMLLMPLQLAFSQGLKPYVLALESTESVVEIKAKIVANLQKNDIEVVGQYQPAADENRWVIVFTCKELKEAVKQIGGLTGFAATLRIGITREGDKTNVTYTAPGYWGNAYFQDEFENVADRYLRFKKRLEKAMAASGTFIGADFGSQKGIELKNLRKYHYMFGMPNFDDTKELREFMSYQAAIDKIDASIKAGVPNVEMVYKLDIPGSDLTLYGFALSGEDGEEKFLPIIDIGDPKHTAFLPYEVLVMGNEVHMLHGRFRIAVAFPDLTMGTFTKIMSTPGNIQDLLEQLVD